MKSLNSLGLMLLLDFFYFFFLFFFFFFFLGGGGCFSGLCLPVCRVVQGAKSIACVHEHIQTCTCTDFKCFETFK